MSIVSIMQEQGIIMASSKYRKLGNTLMLQTPLIMTIEQLKEAFAKLDLVLGTCIK